MGEHDEPETQATPENRARAKAFDHLVDAVWELTESNRDLARQNARLVRLNIALVCIVTVFVGCALGVGMTWASNIVARVEHLEKICLPAKEETL